MPEINRSLGEWAEQLSGTDYIELAAQLRENKAETIHKLGELGLPRFQSVAMTTNEFLADSDAYFDQLGTPTYYASINPNDPQQQRIRAFGIGRDDIYEFVRGVIDKHGSRYDSLILMETAQILYGGNIVVSASDGNPVYAELVQGTHADLVGSRRPVTVTLSRNTLTGNFHFDQRRANRYDRPRRHIKLRHDEEAVRQALFAALMSIPHKQTEEHAPGFELRGTQFRRGYYEIALVRRDRHGPLAPVFIDCSDQPAFLPQDSRD